MKRSVFITTQIVVAGFAATAAAQTPEELLAGSSSPIATSVLLGLMALLPFALVMMTSFAKIAIVLSILRSALGTQNVPPNMVISAVAIVLSAFIMVPVFQQMGDAAGPLFDEEGSIAEMDVLAEQIPELIDPWRRFLAVNSGEAELTLFAEMRGSAPPASVEETPMVTAIAAFALTELAEAFQIGFLLFLPFLVLDLLIGSVLLSLGMHMLSPTSVSLPFKLLLFVLVNGWILLSENLVLSYIYVGGG